MPVVAGSLLVEVRADLSKLGADFAQAEAMAKRAASSIGAAFSANSGLVDQFGRSFQSASNAAAPAADKMAQATSRLASQIGATATTSRILTGALQGTTESVNNVAGGMLAGASAISQVGRDLSAATAQMMAQNAAATSLRSSYLSLGLAVRTIRIAEMIGRGVNAFYDFVIRIRDAEEQSTGAFREINFGIQSTVDELNLAEDKIDETLGKLAGQPPDTLRAGLHAAALEADKLALSLDAVINKIGEELKKNEIGRFGGFISGTLPTSPVTESMVGDSGQGGFRAKLAEINERYTKTIDAATTADEKHAAQMARNVEITAAYSQQILDLRASLMGANTTASGFFSNLASFAKSGHLANMGPLAEDITASIRAIESEQRVAAISTDTADKDAQAKKIEEERAYASASASLDKARLEKSLASINQERDAKIKAVQDTLALAKLASDAEIAGTESAQTRTVMAAAAEVNAARLAAAQIKALNEDALKRSIPVVEKIGADDAAGKDPLEAQRVRIAAEKEVQQLQAETAAKNAELDQAAISSTIRLAIAKQTAARETAQEESRIAGESLNKSREAGERFLEMLARVRATVQETAGRVQEIVQKGSGETQQLRIEGQKLQIERQYGLEISHTGAQQVANLRAVARLDAEARFAKITGLAAEVQTAAALAQQSGLQKDILKAAELQQQLNVLQAESDNKAIQAKTQIAELLQKQNLQYQLGLALTTAGNEVPGALGGALASGIMGSHKHGEDIGTDIEKSLKNVGQQLLGSVFKSSIEQLVKVIGLNTLGQAALKALGLGQQASAITNTGAVTANSTVTALNTAAVLENTAALSISGGAGAAGGGFLSIIGGFLGIPLHATGGHMKAGEVGIVGDKGSEIFVPDHAGTILPHGTGLSGLPSISGTSSVSSSNNIGEMHFHAHGVTNSKEFVRQIARELPNYLKSTGPQFTPASQ